jgi:predicted ferric reductase
MIAGAIRIVIYVLIVILPVLSATWPARDGAGFVTDVARNFALMGFMILMMQAVVAGRFHWIERAFGLDILIRFHKYIAVTAAALLVLHPILLSIGHGSWELLTGLDLPWYIWVGKGALVLVLAQVLVSLYQGKIGLKFERWRRGHDLAALAVLALIFVHSWFAGHDLHRAPMKGLWVVIALTALAVFLYHRVVRPASLRRHAYRVQEVVQETGNVWTVTLTPPVEERIPEYLPGQFHFLTFFREPPLPVEEHHWTISCSPTQKDFISSTIKESGDFTATIGKTRPGDRVAVHGPFGRFSYVLHPGERDLVFLVGGIGITPIMAMIRHMNDVGDTRSVTLLYANRSRDQIVFRDELDRIARDGHPQLRVIHVLSRPEENWEGETGHVDGTMIEKYCGPNLHDKVFYICGPPPMAESLLKALAARGVPKDRIRREIFSFID